jgi:hypothetical protein
LVEQLGVAAIGKDAVSRLCRGLTTGILSDANLEDPTHVRFDSACLERWPDYRRWLHDHPDDRDFMLYRYRQAARVVAQRHRDYFKAMDYGEQGYIVEQYIDETDYRLFLALSDGYARHIASLPRTQCAPAIDGFGDALGNVALARKAFGKDDA